MHKWTGYSLWHIVLLLNLVRFFSPFHLLGIMFSNQRAKTATAADCLTCALFLRLKAYAFSFYSQRSVGLGRERWFLNSQASVLSINVVLTLAFHLFPGQVLQQPFCPENGTTSFCCIIKIEWSRKWFAVALEMVIKVATFILSGIYFFPTNIKWAKLFNYRWSYTCLLEIQVCPPSKGESSHENELVVKQKLIGQRLCHWLSG